MKAIIFAIFALFAINANAANDMLHKKADGSVGRYQTYEAKDMKRSVENNWIFVAYRGCKLMDAKKLIEREKLVANDNIVGGMYCGGKNNSTTILVKNLNQAFAAQ